jgi:hypothetical protein
LSIFIEREHSNHFFIIAKQFEKGEYEKEHLGFKLLLMLLLFWIICELLISLVLLLLFICVIRDCDFFNELEFIIEWVCDCPNDE